jgi:hypothetical protein
MSGSFPGVVSGGGGGGGIAKTDLSATAPILYDNIAGDFSLPNATASVDGAMPATDKARFNAITSFYVAVVTITGTTSGTYGLTINGTAISTSTGGSAATSAAAIVTAIQANGTTNALVTASSAAGVVTITATASNTLLTITGLTAPSPATMTLTTAVPVVSAVHLGTGGLTSSNFLRGNGTFGQVVDGGVSSSAAIAWSKISKSGAVASDVGAQPVDADLTAIAALSAPSVRSILTEQTDGNWTFMATDNVAFTGGTISGTALNLPTSGSGAGAVFRNADALQYIDSTSTTRTLLNSSDNLANLANYTTTRSNLGLTRAGEIDSLFTAAPALSLPRKNAAGTAIEYAAPSSELLANFVGTASVTGVTAETNAYSILIPANTLSDNCRLLVEAYMDYPNNADSKICRIRLGTTGTSSPNVVSTAVTTSASLSYSKALWFSGGTFYVQAATGTGATATSSIQTGSVTYNVDNYLYFNFTPVNTGNTMTVRTASAIIWRL